MAFRRPGLCGAAGIALSIGIKLWANRFGVLVRWLMSFAAWLAGLALCGLALGDAGKTVFLPFVVVSLLWLASVIVHEGGHYAAARSVGMTVLCVVVGRIELQPQRHGFRVRWAGRQKLRAAGYVIAVHDPSRPMRGQSIRMTAGGPGANLLVAFLVGPLAFLWLPHSAAWLMLAFAVVNVALGLGNLIPSSRGLASDGLSLLLWRDPLREHNSAFTHAKLLALTLSGVTADQLSVENLATLEAQPAPMPIVALWYRLKAQQNRGEWDTAAGEQVLFEQLQQELPRDVRSNLGEFLACIRTELAFSLAMRDRDGNHLQDGPMPQKTDWSAPCLWPRCLALRELLDGHTTEGLRLLDEAHRLAVQSLDQSLLPSEVLIRGHMLALATDRKNNVGEKEIMFAG